MSFLYNVLTSDGASLIAQATSSNPIVIISALSSDVAAVSAEDLASKGTSFYTMGAGSIFAASATDNEARIIMRFSSGDMQLPTPKILKSACILGRLASQDDSQAVIMAALSDPDSQVQIPDYSGVVINIPISVTINADDQVETIGGEYASLADLERFVSMYKAGNPTIGDNQTILGNKNFLGNVQAVKVSSPLVEASKTSTNEIEPITNSGTIGFTTKFDFLGTNLINTSSISCDNEGIELVTTSGGCELKFDIQETGHYNYCRITATSEDGNYNQYIDFDFDGVRRCEISTNAIIPSITETTDLGLNNKIFNNGYIKNVYSTYIQSSSIDSNAIDTASIDTATLTGLDPTENQTLSASANVEVPIGCIMLLAVQAGPSIPQRDGANLIGIGSGFSTSSGDYACYVGTMNGTLGAASQGMKTGQAFKSLQSIFWETDGTNYHATFLAMRTA